jgi:KH domain.
MDKEPIPDPSAPEPWRRLSMEGTAESLSKVAYSILSTAGGGAAAGAQAAGYGGGGFAGGGGIMAGAVAAYGAPQMADPYAGGGGGGGGGLFQGSQSTGSTTGSQNCVVQLLIPEKDCGKVIGKGGERLKMLREQARVTRAYMEEKREGGKPSDPPLGCLPPHGAPPGSAWPY